MMTLCFESSTKSHRLIAHLDNRQIEFYGNLKELAQLDERFFRCHNSFVINRHNIESIDSKNVLFTLRMAKIVSLQYVMLKI